MKLRCMLFGHKMPTGYAGGAPYLKIWSVTTDGIEREHAFLEAQCPRCNEKYTAAMLHLPIGTAALWKAEELERFRTRNNMRRSI